RLPSLADRRRMFLGHAVTQLPANPLTPAKIRRRHPKMPPEGARARLVETLQEPRDRLAGTWLADGGFRVGELCGLHLADLHCARMPAAESAAPRMCTSATARPTRTVRGPRSSLTGMWRTARCGAG